MRAVLAEKSSLIDRDDPGSEQRLIRETGVHTVISHFLALSYFFSLPKKPALERSSRMGSLQYDQLLRCIGFAKQFETLFVEIGQLLGFGDEHRAELRRISEGWALFLPLELILLRGT